MSDTMRLSGKTWSGSMFPGDTKGKRKEDAFLDLPLKKTIIQPLSK